MMKTEHPRRPVFEYSGMGFKINIMNAPLIKLGDEWVVDINYNQVHDFFAHVVPLKPTPLTGYEVRFLRRYLGMTLEAWAQAMGVTRQCAMKWEKAGDKPTHMALSTENFLRLYVFNRLGINSAMLKRILDHLIAHTKTNKTVADKKMAANYQINATRPMSAHRYIRSVVAGG